MSTSTKEVVYQDQPLRLISVRLPFWHTQIAKKLGSGNMSRGIRIALEGTKKKKEVA